jgi:hypothetical protein
MMKQVVLFDRGDHWEVIADYSGSSRHLMMSELEWKKEYAGSSYLAMRISQTAAVARCAPRGIGKWLKDWSGPYVVKK